MKIISKSFSQVILQILSAILLTAGVLLLMFTEEVTLIASNGTANRLSIVIQQFLGNAYILLAVMLYLVKDLKGRPLYITLVSLILMGSINLYLIFQFNDLIILPIIYFALQILIQLALLLALIENFKRV